MDEVEKKKKRILLTAFNDAHSIEDSNGRKGRVYVCGKTLSKTLVEFGNTELRGLIQGGEDDAKTLAHSNLMVCHRENLCVPVIILGKELMGLELCQSGDGECLKRRIIAEP
uniref:Uncharacterized protein n=1 Tax=Salix viminalis TaxID=40686 RepID=A0A6N2MAA5_SALVM